MRPILSRTGWRRRRPTRWEYRGVTASLTVDLKEAAITLDPATALTLAEGASAAAAYTVKLAAPPSDTVTRNRRPEQQLGRSGIQRHRRG